MEPLILDASVLIGLLDTEDERHARSVDAVEQADRTGRELLASASAYSESLVAFARVNRLQDARDAIAGIGIVVVSLTLRSPSVPPNCARDTTRCACQRRWRSPPRTSTPARCDRLMCIARRRSTG